MNAQFFARSKRIRFSLLFVLLLSCMWVLSACDSAEDAVKDLIDADFDEDVTLTLEGTAAGNSGSTIGENCDSASVNGLLDELDNDDLDEISLKSIQLNYVDAEYSDASWAPATETLTCRLTISGTESTQFAETAINGAAGPIDVSLTEDQLGVIQYYLDNRNESFTYCVECDDIINFDSYSVTYKVEINVTVKGEF